MRNIGRSPSHIRFAWVFPIKYGGEKGRPRDQPQSTDIAATTIRLFCSPLQHIRSLPTLLYIYLSMYVYVYVGIHAVLLRVPEYFSPLLPQKASVDIGR